MSSLPFGPFEVDIDASLISQLIAGQFPRWAGLPVSPVDFDGCDNRTFRLGENLAVRLPSAMPYAAQVEKENEWLPRLAPLLPLPIPLPLAMGRPASGFPWSWAVYRWIEGEIATLDCIDDLPKFATTLGRFLAALQRLDAAGGPPPGPHNFFRGGSLAIYDSETRDAITALQGRVDSDIATAVWETASRQRVDRSPSGSMATLPRPTCSSVKDGWLQ
jgi:aminoglycoside phosphotransferase (APT) family kinase protein